MGHRKVRKPHNTTLMTQMPAEPQAETHYGACSSYRNRMGRRSLFLLQLLMIMDQLLYPQQEPHRFTDESYFQ